MNVYNTDKEIAWNAPILATAAYRIENINTLDTDAIQMQNRVGKRRKANLKGIGSVFLKILKEVT